MTREHRRDRNGEWHHLACQEYEIDVAHLRSADIDHHTWAIDRRTYTTRWTTGAMPHDYELTVRPVIFHILYLSNIRGIHGIYQVDEYSMEPATGN